MVLFVLRQIHPNAVSLAGSGYSEAMTMRHFDAGDAIAFMQKPCSFG
ncbi:MAG: hypothetical protein K9M17_06935 [Mariprofundaceae bacterium]|nr:hypothetical protein [Mariprofundaceae bacterium]